MREDRVDLDGFIEELCQQTNDRLERLWSHQIS